MDVLEKKRDEVAGCDFRAEGEAGENTSCVDAREPDPPPTHGVCTRGAQTRSRTRGVCTDGFFESLCCKNIRFFNFFDWGVCAGRERDRFCSTPCVREKSPAHPAAHPCVGQGRPGRPVAHTVWAEDAPPAPQLTLVGAMGVLRAPRQRILCKPRMPRAPRSTPCVGQRSPARRAAYSVWAKTAPHRKQYKCVRSIVSSPLVLRTCNFIFFAAARLDFAV